MPPKEDRSGWVAVESDCAIERVAIKAATSAFTYFQKHCHEEVRGCVPPYLLSKRCSFRMCVWVLALSFTKAYHAASLFTEFLDTGHGR
jgi:hypothetical protein